ncbi:hypothetical protein HZA44_02615, partial [Candidatus Peregrinibacteria bacterium]|nr:hypothetical protein [Candidatus Peregrinibacteria bacterium]
IALNFLRQSVLLIFFFVTTLLTHWLMDLGWPTLPSQVSVGISAFVGIMSYLQLRLHIPDLVSQGFREFRSIVAKLADRVFLCDTFPKLENLLNHVFLIKLGFEGMKLMLVRDEKTNEHDIPIYVRDAFTNIVGAHC